MCPLPPPPPPLPIDRRSLKQMLNMTGVGELGLSFGCLEIQYCADRGGVLPDDEVTDENKVKIVLCCRL